MNQKQQDQQDQSPPPQKSAQESAQPPAPHPRGAPYPRLYRHATRLQWLMHLSLPLAILLTGMAGLLVSEDAQKMFFGEAQWWIIDSFGNVPWWMMVGFGALGTIAQVYAYPDTRPPQAPQDKHPGGQ